MLILCHNDIGILHEYKVYIPTQLFTGLCHKTDGVDNNKYPRKYRNLWYLALIAIRPNMMITIFLKRGGRGYNLKFLKKIMPNS